MTDLDDLLAGLDRAALLALRDAIDAQLAALDEGQAAAGAQDPVRARMSQHLGPAIKLLTGGDLIRTLRYNRTGWARGRFLIPGREPTRTTINLPRKLPYATDAEANFELGLEALEALILAMEPERGAPILAFLFQAALAKLAGWRNERYCLFVGGRTGALKTSYAQTALALWGPDFCNDTLLIKWGEGATRNAMMALATHAHDLPLLLDNFKPSTGGGTKDFVNLIHNILEGGEKDRLNRAAQLRDTRPVFCWPLVTGEDVPARDPATLARILVVPFAWQRGEDNAHLTRAQKLAPHLCAVGASWLDWLETDAGRAAAREAGAHFPETRHVWAGKLRASNPDMVNILRVASNLASNQLTWWAMTKHPSIGNLAELYTGDHHAGLETIALEMGEHTTEALEGIRYLEGLRQLLASGRAMLLDTTAVARPENPIERERFIGWEDGAGGAYLIPDVAKQKIEQLLGKEALGYLSKRALYTQLEAMDAIANTDKGKSVKTVKVAGKARKVLHIAAHALDES